MLDYPNYWGVAGYPISHSLTPRLFEILGDFLGYGSVKTVFLEAGDADEFFQRAEKLEGELWISCTSPLKHSVWKRLGCESEEEIQAVNQLVRMDGEWSVSNSDGRGFIMACRHIGVEPGGSILRIRGGGAFPLPAGRQVSISYDEDWKIDDFAVIMVAAQHLEAWKKFFSPNKIEKLPSLIELLELLEERH